MIILSIPSHHTLCFYQSQNISSTKINNKIDRKSTKSFFLFCVGVVPEQAGEVPAERAELGDEPRRLRGQRDGSRVTPASHPGVASHAAQRGEQYGIVAEYADHPGNGPVFLRRLLENDAAALRGDADRQLSRLRLERRPDERESAAVPPSPPSSSSSGRHPSRVPRRTHRERPERSETASASLRLDVSGDAREYVISFAGIESAEWECVVQFELCFAVSSWKRDVTQM